MSVFTNPAARPVEQAAAYPAAILSLLGTRDPLDVLRTTSAALQPAVEGLSAQQLTQPESAGKRKASSA